MRRAGILATLVAMLLGGAAAGPPSAEAGTPPDRPDILILLLDDLPTVDGRMWKHLPNIRDAFIRHGAQFRNVYAETPVCCPGRAALLTGLHTHNHGVDRNDGRLFDPSMSLATQLDGIGYHTLYAGKYFNGYRKMEDKHPPGWDHFRGFLSSYYDYSIYHDGVREIRGSSAADYHTDVLGRVLLRDIREAPANRSLMAMASFMAPHGPYIVARRHRDHPGCGSVAPWSPANYDEPDVSDKPAYIRSLPRLGGNGYGLVSECRMMLAVDEAFGALRDELVAQGRWDNTIVILTSDNGMNAGAHRLHSKGTPYATHLSFLAHWGAGLGTERRIFDQYLSNIDLAPTLCDLAGCTLGPFPNGQAGPDGESFAGLLTGEGPGPSRDALLEQALTPWIGPTWGAVRTTGRSPWADALCAEAAEGGCRWHFVRYSSGERELYDLSNGPCWTWQPSEPGDPCELRNRAGKARYAALEAALAERLRELRNEGGPPP